MMSPSGSAVSTRAIGRDGLPSAGRRRALRRVQAESPTKYLRIRLAGRLDALDCMGGGEVQLNSTQRVLQAAGADARLWQPWKEGFAEFDVLHLFGTRPEFVDVAQAARRHDVRVVLSPITWYSLEAIWREPRSLPRRLLGCARHILRKHWNAADSWRRRLYHACDLLLPNSQAEAAQLNELFGIDAPRMHVVPNAAAAEMAAGNPEAFVAYSGCRDYVLYAGRIEPRKNQLGFLRAMRGSPLPIVVLGDVVPGHERYYQECRKVGGTNVHFVSAVPPASDLLASAYAGCRCLVLASWYETPGLVALEAGLQGVPLVLTKHGSATEYFGELAEYVDPRHRRQLRRAVDRAYRGPRSRHRAQHVRSNYTWSRVGEATLRAYEAIV